MQDLITDQAKSMSMSKPPREGFGFIYIMSNRSMPGVLKVGLTTKALIYRQKELSTTGIPTPFEVEKIYQIDQKLLRDVEKEAHSILKNKNLHHGKEFFKASSKDCEFAVQEAIYKFANNAYSELIQDYEEYIREQELKEAYKNKEAKIQEDKISLEFKKLKSRKNINYYFSIGYLGMLFTLLLCGVVALIFNMSGEFPKSLVILMIVPAFLASKKETDKSFLKEARRNVENGSYEI